MKARIEVIVDRIERLAFDAVVNAANRALLPGAGVDGALRAAAGPELTRLTDTMTPLEAGGAAITPGFNAPAKYIIHVAAPIWGAPGAEARKIAELGACYASAIALAEARKLSSIAFPCLGTGIYGWSPDIACDTALAHTRRALGGAASIARVVFCCFTERDAALYRAALRLA